MEINNILIKVIKKIIGFYLEITNIRTEVLSLFDYHLQNIPTLKEKNIPHMKEI